MLKTYFFSLSFHHFHMSSTTISTLLFLAQNLNVYIGIPLLIFGVLGGLLNIIVFLSLKTFRESPCAFYLTVMSFTNVGQLMTGLLTRIVTYTTGINWTLLSVIYCKFRWYLLDVFELTSYTCICLATIDQFLATSSKIQWQRYSNIKFSRYLCLIFIILWILVEIPILIYYEHVLSATTGRISCALTNPTYQIYFSYIHLLIFSGILPVIFTAFIGLLAIRNIRQIPYRTVPLIRRELDKQLTAMVLIQVIFNFTNLAPTVIYNLTIPNITIPNDPLINSILQLISTIIICLYYSYFAVNNQLNRKKMKNLFIVMYFRAHSIFIFVHRNVFDNN